MHEKSNHLINAVSAGNTLRIHFNNRNAEGSYAGYVFFGREFVMGTAPADYFCQYGYMYPFNMIGFFDKAEASLVIIDDPGFKNIRLHKDADSCYGEFQFQTSANQVNFQIKTFNKTRHFLTDMVKAYRDWFRSKYGNLPASSPDLSGCFNVKRYFFNKSEKFFGAFFDPPRTIFKEDSIQLKELIEEDIEELGDIDAALLFDYSFKDEIRCGNRDPFPFGSTRLTTLNNILSTVKKERSIHFFAYFDPCFIEYGSDWDREYRDSLMLESDDGVPVSIWGEGIWQPDLGNERWQTECSRYLKSVTAGLNVDGVYLDEIGNGTQFKGKANGRSYNQIKAEREFVDHIQHEVTVSKWMCEYPPVAEEAAKFDIVLSDTRTLINIYRFIFPELKFVRVINCDMPIGDSINELNKALFNGEGIWLDHDVRNKHWYPENLKRIIREQTLFKKKYAAFLESSDAEHYWNNGAGMAVNRFGLNNNNLFIVINEGCSPACSDLSVENIDNICIVFGTDCCLEKNSSHLSLRMPPYSVCALLN